MFVTATTKRQKKKVTIVEVSRSDNYWLIIEENIFVLIPYN